MRIAYKRIWKGGPSEEEQDAKLREAGFDVLDPRQPGVYRDGDPERKARRKQQPGDDQLPELTNALRALHPGGGDEIWIAFPECLAHTNKEAMSRLAAITEADAVLGVASLGRTFRWHPHAADALRFTVALGDEADRRRTEKARIAAAEKRKKEDAKFRRKLKEVSALWVDLNMTVKLIADHAGVTRGTLYRWQRLGLLPKVRVEGR